MRVLFTAGGTGGHFYPIIAISEKLNKLIEKNKLYNVELLFMSDKVFDENLLTQNHITLKKISTGKLRRYFSFENFIDIFKTVYAVLSVLIQMYKIYPDVVVGKGGYASFPALFAARFFRIPVIIHESDSVPGKVNKWAGKFAYRIAVSYPSAAEFFPKDRTALVGNPLREAVLSLSEGGAELLGLEEGIPTIFILGGSQGSQKINDTIMQIVGSLVKNYQIIHQTGKANIKDVENISKSVLRDNEHRDRYKAFGHLNDEAMKMSAGAADIIVSRAGSSIFEIAAWGLPSILIPLPDSGGDHQRKNAFTYARTGAAVVVEEANLTPHLLETEINRIMEDDNEREKMKVAAKGFAKLDAAEKVAEQIMQVLLEHRQ